MDRHRPLRRNGFTVIELAVVLAVLVVLALVLLPLLEASRRSSRHRTSAHQLRTVHQGMVAWAQSNQAGGNGGFYPGLDARGEVIPDGPDTGRSGDGTVPAARLWILLDGNFFPPADMISPADAHATELLPAAGLPTPPVTHENFSYAMQSLAADPAERTEWRETLNTAAPMLSDRAIGTGPADISSDWTPRGSGDWRGGLVRNDNSTWFETHHVVTDTKFGNHPVNATDDLFEDDPGVPDAFLVHDDATTAFSTH